VLIMARGAVGDVAAASAPPPPRQMCSSWPGGWGGEVAAAGAGVNDPGNDYKRRVYIAKHPGVSPQKHRANGRTRNRNERARVQSNWGRQGPVGPGSVAPG